MVLNLCEILSYVVNEYYDLDLEYLISFSAVFEGFASI